MSASNCFAGADGATAGGGGGTDGAATIACAKRTTASFASSRNRTTPKEITTIHFAVCTCGLFGASKTCQRIVAPINEMPPNNAHCQFPMNKKTTINTQTTRLIPY